MERLVVKCYVTTNERSPFVALIGDWPARAAFAKSCLRGVRIGARWAIDEENDFATTAKRYVCRTWSSLLSYVRWHHQEFGRHGQDWAIKGLRDNWPQVQAILTKTNKKRVARSRRKERLCQTTR